MDSHLISKAARASHDGSMPFPAIVDVLISAGVEYYHVDYVCMRATFYGAASSTVETSIAYEGLPPIANEFNLSAVRANIVDSQRNAQHYRDFTRRAIEAGVHGYFAFLHGKRVTYFGRQGDQHTEWFPGCAPAE